jgi:FkbM family methyltransferase
MNPSLLSRDRALGSLIRLPLDLVPRNAVVPILYGRMFGKRWIVGSATHACWLGTYELEKQKFIAKHVKPNSVFYDIGANVGFYTLLGSSLVQSGKVVAFEPRPQNLVYLRRHIDLNGASNVQVLEAAVADQNGLADFDLGNNSLTGRLAPGGRLAVRTVALDSLLQQERIPPPDCIKMDIEGGESLALQGARECLRTRKPTVMVATHGRDVERECRMQLQYMGYELQNIGSTHSPDRCELFAQFRP